MAKYPVFLFLLLISSVYSADQEPAETQSSGRASSSAKNLNSIPISSQKSQDTQYYNQQPQQYYPVQYVQNPIQYQQPQHQPAMILIAQPAQVQQQLLTTAAQQLLQYFHGNPQARVQFLQGNFYPNIANVQPSQPQPQPQYVQQQPLPYYHLTSIQQPYQQQQQQQQQPQQYQQYSPIHQVAAQPAASYNIPQATQTQDSSYPSYVVGGQFGHSPSLNHITALAQLTAQKYVPSVNYRSPPPIITGLENFTPEQQAQIKAQLNSGQPITPLKSSSPLSTAALQQLYSSGAKGQDSSAGQDQYQSTNTNDDSKGSNNSNYQSNSNTNSNNYGSYGTKG